MTTGTKTWRMRSRSQRRRIMRQRPNSPSLTSCARAAPRRAVTHSAHFMHIMQRSRSKAFPPPGSGLRTRRHASISPLQSECALPMGPLGLLLGQNWNGTGSKWAQGPGAWPGTSGQGTRARPSGHGLRALGPVDQVPGPGTTGHSRDKGTQPKALGPVDPRVHAGPRSAYGIYQQELFEFYNGGYLILLERGHNMNDVKGEYLSFIYRGLLFC